MTRSEIATGEPAARWRLPVQASSSRRPHHGEVVRRRAGASEPLLNRWSENEQSTRSHDAVAGRLRRGGPNQAADKPFGEIPGGFLRWVFELESFRSAQGLEGGRPGSSSDVIAEAAANLDATIIGRNMFGGGPGAWQGDAWKGWWGDNPPYHTPVFVVTHHPREPLVMQGGTTFYFVTDGIESALAQARQAAGKRDIRIGGGANLVNQYLAAGLVDELELHLLPFILGGGARLFEGLGSDRPQLELVRVIPSPEAIHVKYRLVKR